MQAALIVVAEGDALIRMGIVAALVDEGFEVIEAGHAAEAISHLETRGQDVRVLFTDVDMPGEMDGVRLAHHARSHGPQIGVIVDGRAEAGRAVLALRRLGSAQRLGRVLVHQLPWCMGVMACWPERRCATRCWGISQDAPPLARRGNVPVAGSARETLSCAPPHVLRKQATAEYSRR